MPSLAPVQGIARFGIQTDDIANLAANGYSAQANNDLYGVGHMGVAPLDRIIMSLESGIDSEVEYALNTLTYYSCNEPKLLDFSTHPIIGNELIAHFIKPYHMYSAGNESAVTDTILSTSVEALLSLRNAVQDLGNQQWLCQVDVFRKYANEALKYLVGWCYSTQQKSYRQAKTDSLFRESLTHLLDILDPVTCFYVETPKNDPMFANLLTVLSNTNDKYVLVTVIKCLTHLLYLGGTNAVASRSAESPDTNNCIDAVQPDHLKIITSALFVNDEELSFTVLSFLKQYLSSEALHQQYKSSVANSKLHRLRKLVEATGSKRNLHVLLKQLPELIVARLPLVDPSRIKQPLPLQLSKRSTYSGIPAATPQLPQKLYDIIVTFPEPLRATTWLRCCYEPHVVPSKDDESTAVPAGEVTQISLWKSYENQFEAIWKDRSNPSWPNLLPAVDFIKNVSSAFPNSEAMVVNIPSADPAQPARKKFIIKGIQPRQFPVNIDIGNFEALRKSIISPDERSSGVAKVGDVDKHAFDESLKSLTNSILATSEGLTSPDDTSAPWYTPINGLSRDILSIIIENLLNADSDGEYKNVFRQYNRDWLPDLVYANPGLVERGYVDGRWLRYLL